MDYFSLNKNINHPLQSFEWGEFREKTGIKVIRENNFQLTLHKIPHTNFNIGYIPKGNLPTQDVVKRLKEIGEKENCIFIQIEPNIKQEKGSQEKIKKLGFVESTHPLLTKYTYILDLKETEEELLKKMHHKTRYNIKVAQKKGVKIEEDNSDKIFKEYLRLSKETTQRQKFYAHTESYHKILWETLKAENNKSLTAHLFKATLGKEILATWILFVFKDLLYYPYGASSTTHKDAMASNLMMWEVIKWGKQMGLKQFDMWGSLGPDPDPKDPWYGFHKFKSGYGADLIEFIGSFDLIIKPPLYKLFILADKIRWKILK